MHTIHAFSPSLVLLLQVDTGVANGIDLNLLFNSAEIVVTRLCDSVLRTDDKLVLLL